MLKKLNWNACLFWRKYPCDDHVSHTPPHPQNPNHKRKKRAMIYIQTPYFLFYTNKKINNIIERCISIRKKEKRRIVFPLNPEA